MKALELVFERLDGAGLTLQLEKCVFVAKEVPYLSHIIDGEFIRADKQNITEYPVPTIVKELSRFIERNGKLAT